MRIAIFGRKDRSMARFLQKHKMDIGSSPDEMWRVERLRQEKVVLELIRYDKDGLEESRPEDPETALAMITSDRFSWLDVSGLHDTEVLQRLAEYFDLDSLVIADITQTVSRPKVTEYDNCLAISLKMLRLDADSNKVQAEHLTLLIGDQWLISFQELSGDVFEPVRERLRRNKRRISSSGPDYLAFALMDTVVDQYIYILSLLGDRIENIESRILTNSGSEVLDELHSYKQELNYLRKNILPTKDMIASLNKMDSELLRRKNHIHFLDLQNNMAHATESSESYREILSDHLNVYHTIISSKLNEVMRFLTVFSVVFIPPTFIAGVYGTNFTFIPELSYHFSYHIMLLGMLIIALSMLYYFKRKGWLS